MVLKAQSPFWALLSLLEPMAAAKHNKPFHIHKSAALVQPRWVPRAPSPPPRASSQLSVAGGCISLTKNLILLGELLNPVPSRVIAFVRTHPVKTKASPRNTAYLFFSSLPALTPQLSLHLLSVIVIFPPIIDLFPFALEFTPASGPQPSPPTSSWLPTFRPPS